MTLPKHIEELLDSVEMPERSPMFVHPDEHERMIRAHERAATEREIVEWLHKYYGDYVWLKQMADAIERGEYRKAAK